MFYKVLADITVLVHFLWIVFLFLGALWGRRSRTVKIFHLSGLAFALIIQIFDWFCPLTHLEVWLRERHNPGLTYAGSFIIYYVEKIVYIEISHYIVLIVTLLLSGFNIWIYLRK
jgi:predicted branched-subunit amino acid permease